MATLINFFNSEVLSPIKQINLSFHKVPMLSIKVRLENLLQQSRLMCISSSWFNNHNNRAPRPPRCKTFQMAYLIRRTEMLHPCPKEYLGVFRVLRSITGLCKSIFVFYLDSVMRGSPSQLLLLAVISFLLADN